MRRYRLGQYYRTQREVYDDKDIWQKLLLLLLPSVFYKTFRFLCAYYRPFCVHWFDVQFSKLCESTEGTSG